MTDQISSSDYDKKYCPLFSIAMHEETSCLKEQCGFWSHGTKRCAIVAMLRK